MQQYIDMHCDTLAEAYIAQYQDIFETERLKIDIKRLKKGGAAAQFFAMFLPQSSGADWFGEKKEVPMREKMQGMYEIFCTTLEKYPEYIAKAGNYEDWEWNRQKQKLSAFLTIENAAVVDGRMENLEKLYEMGVRLMTLTWNDDNCFGASHSENPQKMNRGLTDFGKEALERMNELGMIIDVSHLSDGGFYDVAEISKKPFVASHSNCRALCPATRNLTDDMIQKLAEKGGVAGINFAPYFVDPKEKDPVCSIELLIEHIRHFIRVGGEECVGIGTDFDGMEGNLEIDGCEKMPMLFERMADAGISPRMIDKIACGNVARVIWDVM
ncbi:MAG: membrane dipeptidase [Eubacterium sp.]|nr:membrane dipeptidase [Eubacterium sp.]